MTPHPLLKMLSTGIAIVVLGSQGAAQTKPASPNTDPKALPVPFSLRAFAVNMSNIGPGRPVSSNSRSINGPRPTNDRRSSRR